MAEPLSSRRTAKALASLTEIAEPLQRLQAIRRVRDSLDELSQDAVDEARTAGATWKQIGAVHGISKQAAQQRFRRPAAPAPQPAGDDPESESRAARHAEPPAPPP